MPTIAENLLNIHQLIRRYENYYHRETGSTELLAVSKGQSIDKIADAITAGQKRFGENYLQEALEKISHFNDPSLEWHFIGAIQSNKTKLIAENFQWVQSVENFKIAERLNDQRPEHLPPLNICIQVNISEEDTKSGVAIADVPELVKQCANLPRLTLRGLMAIPQQKKLLRDQRVECMKLRLLWENLYENANFFDTLSVGMSDDLEAAVAEGSTMVRIGTKIFGKR